MSDPMGLSIGTTNLVAVRVGNQPVIRRPVLTLPDGTTHPAEQLLVSALAEIADAGPVAIAYPAHWGPVPQRALRTALRGHPVLGSARLVSDAVAALTALRTDRDLQGLVALVDVGAGGTGITLLDAGEPIDETTRHTAFSGDLVDQLLLDHVLNRLAATGQSDLDEAGTVAVVSLSRLRDECRAAKERLSAEPVVDVAAELPQQPAVVSVSRADLDALLDDPFDGVVAALDSTLQRNGIGRSALSALAVVGGGAPLVAHRFTALSGVPVVVTTRPGLDAAAGAAALAAMAVEAEAPTGLAPVPPEGGAEAPTAYAPVAPAEATASAPALAWSQDDAGSEDPVPYRGAPYEPVYDTGALRPPVQYVPASEPVDEPRAAWQRIPGLVFGLAAAVAVLAVGGVAIALTSVSAPPSVTEVPRTTASPPAPAPASVAPSMPPEAPPPPPVLETVPSEPPPPPVTVEPPPPAPPSTVTITETTTPSPTTTTTTTTTSTTTTSTTAPTETTSSETSSATSSETTSVTTTPTTPAMRTTHLNIPFLPPIPIEVPQNPIQPPPPPAPMP
ncbi:Hsp70 family protein [Mycolicibacterium phlei]|uniref:Hsp70 family protein n=1 Tax=Mycolicibacterium phlei TaxID=1771 RepID=UPI0037C4FF06